VFVGMASPLTLSKGASELYANSFLETASLTPCVAGPYACPADSEGKGPEIGESTTNLSKVIVRNNIFANRPSANASPWLKLVNATGPLVEDNIVYNWAGSAAIDPSVVGLNGQQLDSQNEIARDDYCEPSRGLKTYGPSNGSTANFLALARAQSRESWNPALT